MAALREEGRTPVIDVGTLARIRAGDRLRGRIAGARLTWAPGAGIRNTAP